jgi:hypothetical protein
MRLAVAIALLTALPRANAAADEYTPINRVYVDVAGFAGRSGYGYTGDDLPPAIGGFVGTGGAEIGLANGATLGFELAPFTWVSATTRPSLSARFAAGYARKKLALALEAGSTLTWLYPQLGPSLRIGALDATFARLRVSWALWPAVPVPVDLDFLISTPIATRWRAQASAGAVYGSTTGVFATAGLSYQPGGARNLRGGVFTAGVGVSWMQWALGPMITVGYERRL